MAEVSRYVSPMPVSRAEAFAWHARPGALQRLLPPWQAIRLLHNDASVAIGSRVEMRMGLGPLSLPWTARHSALDLGHSFVDVAERGPFASWEHRHRVVDPSPGDELDAVSMLEDEVHWALPLHAVSGPLLGGWVRRELGRMFAFRHARTAEDLLRHAEFAGRAPLRVGITGASGGIGGQLEALLQTGGHTVVRLGRREGDIAFDATRGKVDASALEGLDALVHLAGAPIATRWTAGARAEIMASREVGTAALARALAGLRQPPAVWISASATGFYGDRPQGTVDEAAGLGAGFAAEVCRRWEAAAEPAKKAGIRVVHARFGVVLDPQHGALAKMLPAFRAGLGGRIGHGRQGMSWIAIDDALYALLALLHDARAQGPINLVAPGATSQAELASTLGRVLRRPVLLPVPAWVLRLALGTMAEDLVLGGAIVRPTVLQALGFRFSTPDLEPALRHLLGRPSR